MLKNVRKYCLVVTVCEDFRVYFCDLKLGFAIYILKGYLRVVILVVWLLRNDYFLVSGSRDNKVFLWDVRKVVGSIFLLDQYNGKGGFRLSIINIVYNGYVNGIFFLFDGLYLLIYGIDDRLRLWDIFIGKNILVNFGRVYNFSRKAVKFCLFSGIIREVVFVLFGSSIEVFEIEIGKYVVIFTGYYNNVNCCIFYKYF